MQTEPNKDESQLNEQLIKIIQRLIAMVIFLVIALTIVSLIAIYKPNLSTIFETKPVEVIDQTLQNAANEEKLSENDSSPDSDFWQAPDVQSISDSKLKAQVEYGRELIAHTAKYLGPNGSVMQITNGMNCQNCHLEAGTKAWGNNYAAVYSTYPKYRARSGKQEDIYKRVNDCFERSLNGKPLANNSNEMQAIKAYIEFLGSEVIKGDKPKGTGIYELTYLDRAADPIAGKSLYSLKCQSCHQPEGQGLIAEGQIEYTYPPLWGKNSYNEGAGLYRLSRLAGYIRYNMPQGASYSMPQLTDEESWDLAAYINSQVRPKKDLSADWPKVEEKPVDHPFGPYADGYSESQHKYGPFQPIADFKKKFKSPNKI